MRKRKIDLELERFANNLRLRHLDQWCVNLEMRAFQAGFGGKVRELFKCGNELGPAIGIAAVIERINANENVEGADDFRPSQCVGKEDGIARRDVSDWNPLRDLGGGARFRNVD